MDTAGKHVKIDFKTKDATLNKLLCDAVEQFNLKLNKNNDRLQVRFELNGHSHNVHSIIDLKDMSCIPIHIVYVYNEFGDKSILFSNNFHVEELLVSSPNRDADTSFCIVTFTNVKL